MTKNRLTVTKDNRVIEASYTLTLSEQRVLLACIAQIDSRKPLPLDQNRFEVSVADIVDLAGSTAGNAARDVKAAVDRLYERSIVIDGHGGAMRWISGKEYDEGLAIVYFSPQILPYLSQLSERFTTYKLAHIAKFKSTYSIRIYELLVQWTSAGEREIAVEKLREILQVEDKYQQFKDFKKCVVQLAVLEINRYSNLWCEIGLRKRGRVVTHIQFKFKLKESAAKPAKPIKPAGDVNEFVRQNPTLTKGKSAAEVEKMMAKQSKPKPKPKHTLDELLTKSDYSQPQPPEDREWIAAPAVGRELL